MLWFGYKPKKLKNFKHSRIVGAFVNFKQAIQTLLQSLDVNATNNEHNLWKETKKRPPLRNVPVKDLNDLWCRTDQGKANAFAEHLEQTFKPFSFNSNENHILRFLDSVCQMDLPV